MTVHKAKSLLLFKEVYFSVELALSYGMNNAILISKFSEIYECLKQNIPLGENISYRETSDGPVVRISQRELQRISQVFTCDQIRGIIKNLEEKKLITRSRYIEGSFDHTHGYGLLFLKQNLITSHVQ